MLLRSSLLALLIITHLWASAQPDMDWYYPKLGIVKPNSKKAKGVYIGMDVEASGCVSGNCKNGNGVFIKVSRVYDSAFHSTSIEPALDIIKYEGVFSAEGKHFEGAVYKRRVYYDITNASDNDDARMSPKAAYATNDESFWNGNMIGKGAMIGENYNSKNVPSNYTWEGWMEGRPSASGKESSPFLGAARAFYQWGKLKYVELAYQQPSAYKKIKASVRPGGALLGAVIQYSDGSQYEGMLCRGKYNGPGRYTDPKGSIKEGIWMLDSLATPMKVVIPKAFIEPVTGEVAKKPIRVVDFTYQLSDAGDGWKYNWSQTAMMLIKMNNDEASGPGLFISLNEDEWKLLTTYRSGLFADGDFDKGMLAREELSKRGNGVLNGERYTYSHSSFSVVTGEIKNDRLLSGCAKKTWYDANDRPITLLEGEFYAKAESSAEERPWGWMYKNDWAGQRDAAHLHYYYAGWDIMELTKEADWIINAGTEAEEGELCYGVTKAMTGTLLKRIKERGDSILTVRAKEKKDLDDKTLARITAYNSPEAVAQRRKAAEECAAAIAKNAIKPGTMFNLSSVGDQQQRKFIISGAYDCKTGAYPGDLHYWFHSVGDKGYYVAVPATMSPEQLKFATKAEGSYGICGTCKGTGILELTEMTKVEVITSYKVERGRLVVNSSEPLWTHYGKVVCNRCSGRGFYGGK